MMRQMIKPAVAVLCSSVILTGCFSSSSSSSPTAQVRVFHGVSDAPPVNVSADGANVVEGADFKESAVLDVPIGTRTIAVDAILPEDQVTTVIGPASISIASNRRYDVLAAGSVGGDSVQPVILDEPDPNFSSNENIRLRLVHLAELGGDNEVEVYVGGDDLNPDETDPVVGFEFGDDAGPLELPSDDYRIKVQAGGDTVFDSGYPVTFPAGRDWLIVAVENTGANQDASPISLAVLDGDEVIELFDKDQQAGLRAVHNSVNAPEVSIEVDGSEVGSFNFPETLPEVPALDNYEGVDAGDVVVEAVLDGTGEVLVETLTTEPGVGYTVLAMGLFQPEDGEPELRLQTLTDSVRSIVTQASLRVVHGAAEAGPVDVYLVPDGEEVANVAPALPSFEFGMVTDYLPVVSGEYTVVVAAAGSSVSAEEDGLFSADVELSDGGVYTAIARDDEDNETPGGFTLLDDFVE